KAIQELDLKLSIIESQTIAQGGFSLNSLFTTLQEWLGNVGNGITRIWVRDELCIGDTCINESDLEAFKNWQGQTTTQYSSGNEYNDIEDQGEIENSTDNEQENNNDENNLVETDPESEESTDPIIEEEIVIAD